MANLFDNVWKSTTITPGVDMSDKMYRFVTVGVDGLGKIAATATIPVGVIYEPNKINQPAQVVVQGYAFVKCEEAIKGGDMVKVGAAGGAAITALPAEAVGVCVAGGKLNGLCTILLK